MESVYSFILRVIFALFVISTFNAAQTAFITKTSDLEFGDVFMGHSKEITDTDIGAAKFMFYHTRWFRRNVSIRFALPSYLENAGDRIPIEFNQTHSTWSYNDQLGGRTNFDPYSRLRINRVWFYTPVYIWLGGKITTTQGLTPGEYSGNIIITITY